MATDDLQQRLRGVYSNTSHGTQSREKYMPLLHISMYVSIMYLSDIRKTNWWLYPRCHNPQKQSGIIFASRKSKQIATESQIQIHYRGPRLFAKAPIYNPFRPLGLPAGPCLLELPPILSFSSEVIILFSPPHIGPATLR